MTIRCTYSCGLCGADRISFETEIDTDGRGKWVEEVATPAVIARHRQNSPGCRPALPGPGDEFASGLTAHFEPVRYGDGAAEVVRFGPKVTA